MLTLENQFKVRCCKLAMDRFTDFFELDKLIRQAIDVQWLNLGYCDVQGVLRREDQRKYAEILMALQESINAAKTLPKLKEVSIAAFERLVEIEQEIMSGIRNHLLGDLHILPEQVPPGQAVDEWLIDEPKPSSEMDWLDIYGEMS